jgi:zinc/manganese transport system substrate-binding protein
VIINGLCLEGWLPRLLQSSGSKAAIIEATMGVAPLKSGTAADPHAWQSVKNAEMYVRNIRDALANADPADADFFHARAERYLAELDALDREVRDAVGNIPPARRKVISTHDAFGYFAAAYGIAFIAPLGVSTETEPSARDIAKIIGRSGPRRSRRCSWKISATTGWSAGSRPRPAPGSAERCFPTA